MNKQGMIGVMDWVRVLPKLENNILCRLSSELGITYSHIFNITREFEKRRWIAKERIGRHHDYKLTVSGKKMSLLCEEMLIRLDSKESRD